MKPVVVLGLATAGVAAFLCLPRESRRRLNAAPAHWMAGRFERMMASLPENAPPKLIMSILPRLREQNDQIISLLQEQNDLIREWPRGVQKKRGSGPGVK